MNNTTYNQYKKNIEELLERPLFSYPFYDKSDDELILDAKERTEKHIEFGIFELGQCESKSVIAGSGKVNTKYFNLYSPLKLSKKTVQIKVSSFVYPLFFFSTVIDHTNTNTLRSSIDNKLFDNYNSIVSYIDKHSGKYVLVTNYLSMINKFGNFTYCVNLLTTPTYDDELAYMIRENFLNERIKFINDLKDKPYKYIESAPIKYEILENVLKEFQQKIDSELKRLKDYELPTNPQNYEGPDEDSSYDIARENFYALTDGQYGDFRPRYNEDDDEDYYRY